MFVVSTKASPIEVTQFDKNDPDGIEFSKQEGCVLVNTEAGLENLSSQALVTLYNRAVTDKPITKFQNRAVAVKRVWPLLPLIAVDRRVPGQDRRKADRRAADNGERKRGRKSEFTGKYIYKLAASNPRREGTHGHKAFEALMDGMTYEQYLAAGGGRNHLAWDLEHRHVELLDAPRGAK
jgi:hypothetical protein